MFAGETQADVLMETYLTIPAGVLIVTGLVKAMLTPALINLGWRGGHFFPVIFSGVSLGYGLAILTGADPVFCVAVCTASTRRRSWATTASASSGTFRTGRSASKRR